MNYFFHALLYFEVVVEFHWFFPLYKSSPILQNEVVVIWLGLCYSRLCVRHNKLLFLSLTEPNHDWYKFAAWANYKYALPRRKNPTHPLTHSHWHTATHSIRSPAHTHAEHACREQEKASRRRRKTIPRPEAGKVELGTPSSWAELSYFHRFVFFLFCYLKVLIFLMQIGGTETAAGTFQCRSRSLL